MTAAVTFMRRSWKCPRCGKTWFLIGGFRNPVHPPRCHHNGTPFDAEPDRAMQRSSFEGKPGGRP